MTVGFGCLNRIKFFLHSAAFVRYQVRRSVVPAWAACGLAGLVIELFGGRASIERSKTGLADGRVRTGWPVDAGLVQRLASGMCALSEDF